MRADICDAQDARAVERLRSALTMVGAERVSHEWALGVDQWRFRVGADTVTIFVDAWSVDIDGPTELVERVLEAMRVENTP